MTNHFSVPEMAATRFEAVPGVTDNFKTNEQMIRQAIAWAPYERMCAVILEQDSDQLAAMVKSNESANCFLDFTDNLAQMIEYQEASLEVFHACRARLRAACARYAERVEN